MGLFDDTIHDARRPLAGAWVRRAATEATEIEVPGADDLTESEPSGMQTVFRFQKAESPAMPGGLRKAPYQPGAEYSRLPAGDPLSAGTEDESPESPAQNVTGNRDVSVKSDSRTSSLETGQEEHASPSKVAVANAKFGSATVQSVVSSGPVETKLSREKQSNIPEGSEQPGSRSGETYWSRPTGRGAPSDFFSSTTAEVPGQVRLLPPRARSRRGEEGPRPDALTARPGAEPADMPETAPPAAARPATSFQEYTPRVRSVALPAHPGGGAHIPTPGPVPEPVQSGLVIGRIDVVVVAGNPQPRSPAGSQTDGSFLSRNYLKRL